MPLRITVLVASLSGSLAQEGLAGVKQVLESQRLAGSMGQQPPLQQQQNQQAQGANAAAAPDSAVADRLKKMEEETAALRAQLAAAQSNNAAANAEPVVAPPAANAGDTMMGMAKGVEYLGQAANFAAQAGVKVDPMQVISNVPQEMWGVAGQLAGQMPGLASGYIKPEKALENIDMRPLLGEDLSNVLRQGANLASKEGIDGLKKRIEKTDWNNLNFDSLKKQVPGMNKVDTNELQQIYEQERELLHKKGAGALVDQLKDIAKDQDIGANIQNMGHQAHQLAGKFGINFDESKITDIVNSFKGVNIDELAGEVKGQLKDVDVNTVLEKAMKGTEKVAQNLAHSETVNKLTNNLRGLADKQGDQKVDTGMNVGQFLSHVGEGDAHVGLHKILHAHGADVKRLKEQETEDEWFMHMMMNCVIVITSLVVLFFIFKKIRKARKQRIKQMV